MSHGLAGRVLPLKGDDALAVYAAELIVMRVGCIHAERVVELLEELTHHFLYGFEVEHHVIFIQRLGGEYQLYAARVPMRERAAAGVLGEQVAALQLDGFADAVHGRLSKQGLHPSSG